MRVLRITNNYPTANFPIFGIKLNKRIIKLGSPKTWAENVKEIKL